MKPYALPTILLLANIVLAVFMATAWQKPFTVTRATPPTLAAQRVHLAGETFTAVPLPAPESAAIATAPPAEASQTTSSASHTPMSCLRWTDLTLPDLHHAEALLRKNAFVGDFEEHYAKDKAKYWVFIPPLPTAAAAKHRAMELHGKGFDAFAMGQDSPMPNAVSLALFSQQELAEEFLTKVKNKGIPDAVNRPHPLSRFAELSLNGVRSEQKANYLALAGKIDKSRMLEVDCHESEGATLPTQP